MTYTFKKRHVVTLALGCTLIAAAGSNLAAQDVTERPSLVQCHDLLPGDVQYDLTITADIDTREGREGSIRMSLVDSTKPGVEDIPAESGEFLK